MVDFARIQNRIYYGYGKASQRLGVNFSIYRSPSLINPIVSANLTGTTLISIDEDLTYKKARKYGDYIWQFLPLDGLTKLQDYDYIVGPSITYFIADIAPDDRLTPPLCVECNTTINITRTMGNLQPGTNPYQEYLPTITPTNVALNCPASVIENTRTYPRGDMKLPTSVRMPMYDYYIPDLDDSVIMSGDVLDDLGSGRRLQIYSAERTKKTMGFRITAHELGT